MSENKFERFGKYLILDHLVDGGMAKICRARFLGEQANKMVAIKMIQPQHSKDPAFVQMFEDELKITFGLLHPNIIQMFDYGMVNDQLFTTMEYVHGADLKQYLERLKEKKCVFPEEISVYIISQVCQGLHYAHTFTDKLTGKPFNIIHRDISPHNIMLTYDGAVKVIDFGIAKADSNSEATQAGTIKGKLSYLAPEYLDGLELDPRYDIFSVGITLWEMLTGRKLFTASNDLAVLKQIQACKIPRPSKFNPHVPKELDAIVLKALSKDRNQRYEDMDKFNRSLVKFLYANYPDFNATDLNAFAEQLFEKEISRDRVKFVEYGKIDIKPFLDDLQREMEGKKRKKDETITDVDSNQTKLRRNKVELDLGIENASELTESLTLDFGKTVNASSNERAASKTSKVRVGTAKQRSSSNASAITQTKSNRGSTAARKVRKAGGAATRSRVVKRKTRSQKKSSGSSFFAVVASIFLALLLWYQSDTVKSIVGLKGGKDTNNISSGKHLANKSSRSPAHSGKISFKNYDYEMTILINGSKAMMKGIEAHVPIDRQLEVQIKKPGHKVFVQNIRLTSKNPYTQIVIPELEKEKTGFISSSRNFSLGSKLIIQIDGKQHEYDLPLDNHRVPAGNYNAVIANPLLGTERKIQLNIKENKKFLLE